VLADDPSCVYQPKATAAPIERVRPVTYGMHADRTMPWDAAAEARLQRIPSFVRAVVAHRIEEYAKRHGQTEITLNVMREVRQSMPVDFSKKRPFFLDEE
jgi:Proto-chlorophyllide reductase 57 kD subunit